MGLTLKASHARLKKRLKAGPRPGSRILREMDVSVIDAAKLAAALPMASAIDALERALRAERLPEAPPRSHIPANEGELLLMPAVGEKASLEALT